MSIVRVRPAGTDVYGDPEDGEPGRLTIVGAFTAAAAAGQSAETRAPGREAVRERLTLYAPVGTDIRHTDQVDIDGRVYDVDAEPSEWIQPHTGWRAGVEVLLVRATG